VAGVRWDEMLIDILNILHVVVLQWLVWNEMLIDILDILHLVV